MVEEQIGDLGQYHRSVTYGPDSWVLKNFRKCATL